MKTCYNIVDTKWGPFTIVCNEQAVIKAGFFSLSSRFDMQEKTPLLLEAEQQLAAYLSGSRTGFDLPLQPQGTPFQQKVWTALQQIPHGETRTYRQIAEQIGQPTAARAVGMANHRNPLLIFIPCHRVVGCDGALTGYAGGVHMKRELLHLEGICMDDSSGKLLSIRNEN